MKGRPRIEQSALVAGLLWSLEITEAIPIYDLSIVQFFPLRRACHDLRRSQCGSAQMTAHCCAMATHFLGKSSACKRAGVLLGPDRVR